MQNVRWKTAEVDGSSRGGRFADNRNQDGGVVGGNLDYVPRVLESKKAKGIWYVLSQFLWKLSFTSPAISDGRTLISRSWSSHYHKAPFYDAYCLRQPDMVNFVPGVYWMDMPDFEEPDSDSEQSDSDTSNEDVQAIHEVKVVENPLNIDYVNQRTAFALVQLGHTARLLSRIQPNRMHVLGTLIVNSQITLVIYDRSGAVRSETYDMDDQPELFLVIVLGFMYANNAEMGFDPTIKLYKGMKTGEMQVFKDKKWYPIVDVLHVEGTIHGRGTVCYKITNPYGGDWKEAVVKDCWADTTRDHPEDHNLAQIEGVEGTPKLISTWTVEDDVLGVHTTARFRPGVVEAIEAEAGKRTTYEWKLGKHNNIEIREQRRIVMTPVGIPIQHFTSLIVLLTVFRHIVISMSSVANDDLNPY